jgi:ribA/ribD-fused uncharacterized protein
MISQFKDEYRFLSNFWPCAVEFEGMVFPSVEHAHVAAKTTSIEIRCNICELTAGQATCYGKTMQIRDDWLAIRLTVMDTLVRSKFENDILAKKLLATGDQLLQEGNTWGDTFWGVYNRFGENHLGKTLMRVRNELRRP